MTDNPTTKRVPWMVEAHGCKCLNCVIDFGVWRDRLATAEARVGDLESAIAKWKIEEGEWIAENTQLRADLAALVPPVRWALTRPSMESLVSADEETAARAALARVEARQ